MNSRYTPVTLLGSGGMADVYLTVARGHRGVTKLAVVKRLREHGDAWLRAMFLDEARVATRLNHPNVVHAYETWESKGEHFLAMEYVEGMPLNELLRELTARKETLTEPVASYIASQVLKGLHYVHELRDFDGTPLDIVHRDVSPHNICITYDGEVKLLDFGVAKSTLNVTQTQQGALKGKVRYMAPEQARAEGIDRRADVFALGIVFWEMLAGGPLFNGHPLTVLGRVMRGDIQPVKTVREQVTPELDAIAMRALATDKAGRYATADEMREALAGRMDAPKEEGARRELARWIQEIFAPARDAMRSQVQGCISMLKASEHDPSTSGSLVFFAADWSPEPEPPSPVRAPSPPRPALAPRPPPRQPRVAFALSVAVVVAATLVVLAKGPAWRRDAQGVAVSPVGSAAAEWPPPAPSASVAGGGPRVVPAVRASDSPQPDPPGPAQAASGEPAKSHHPGHHQRDRRRMPSPKIKMLDDDTP